MEKKKVVRKKKAPKKHIVVFQNIEEKVLKTEFVNDGESAQAPVMPELLEERMHHRILFSGWDQDLECVHSNLIVKPLYREVPKEYLIMYFHENGKILGTETVSYGQDAKAEYNPVKKETDEYRYHFLGWSCDLHNVDKDLMAKALFREERKSFPVRFYDADSHLMKEDMVFFGESALAPSEVRKEEDARYYYHFDGWDREFDNIKGPLDVHAQFWKEYKEYQVRFLQEGKLIEENNYHYHDYIHYPKMTRKGYDFIWESPVTQVTESKDINGFWSYSNPKGKVFTTKEGVFEIVDPSISSGSARCLSFHSNQELLNLPERVKLGDYYYTLEYLHEKAFSQCPNVKDIICSHKLKYLEKRCFSSCRKLRSVRFGRSTSLMEEEIFLDCPHLKEIYFEGKNSMKVSRQAFERMNRRVECSISAKREKIFCKLLERPIREKGLIIKKV